MDHWVDEKTKNKIVGIISVLIPEAKIYLFGSRAKGTNQPSSDIDIAIDCGLEVSNKILGRIKEDVEESTIPFLVDIVDFNCVTDEMKQEINKYGIPWKV